MATITILARIEHSATRRFRSYEDLKDEIDNDDLVRTLPRLHPYCWAETVNETFEVEVDSITRFDGDNVEEIDIDIPIEGTPPPFVEPSADDIEVSLHACEGFCEKEVDLEEKDFDLSKLSFRWTGFALELMYDGQEYIGMNSIGTAERAEYSVEYSYFDEDNNEVEEILYF